jgi:hypothetical protein
MADNETSGYSEQVLRNDEAMRQAPAPSAAESPELRYARQTRNAVVFIAVLAGIGAVLALIGVIVLAHELSVLDQLSNNSTNPLGG